MNMLQKNWPVTALFGVPVDCIGKSQLLDCLRSCIFNRQSVHLVTINAEMAYAATQNTTLMAALQQAELIIPDGIGVVWALGRQGMHVQRLPGIELVEELLQESAQKGLKIAILGSSQATLTALPAQLEKRFGTVQCVYSHHGFFKEEEIPEILGAINAAEPDVLFVALGVPKQECFIARWRQQLQVPVLMGVGGSFDVLSGQLKRAPRWLRKIHLEWFYRLLQQPSRWRRMLALPRFVFKVMFS